jgi:hypothetical protein
MSKQHTPGPWIPNGTKGPNRPIRAIQIMTESFVEIANIKGSKAYCAIAPPEERIANAHLIAAAPEMLAALREAHEAMMGGEIQRETAAAIVWAAISKAEGIE